MKRSIVFFLPVWIILTSGNASGQSAVERLLENHSGTFPEYMIAETSTSGQQYRQEVGDYRLHDVHRQALDEIFHRRPQAFRFSLNTPDGPVELQLVQRDITTPDFRIGLNGSENAAYIAQGVHYRGAVVGRSGSLAAVSVFDGEISVVAALPDKGNLVFRKLQHEEGYISFYENDVRLARQTECGVDADMEAQAPPVDDLLPGATTARAGNCVRVHLEGNYELYRDEGQSVPATISYLEGMFNVVSVLYGNESIDIALSYINVWNTPDDPFSDQTSNEGLTTLEAYVDAGNTVHGDLIHLVSGSNENNGGIAWVNVLCHADASKRSAYSNVNGYYTGLPLTYSWDVQVFAHEMGHNLGSRHTHSCNWNGNSTQIDDCGNVYVHNMGGTPEGSACFNASNPIIPSSAVGGTVMSYCHLTSAGINFANGFGQQPGDLIRSRVQSAACLDNCDGLVCSAPYNVLVSGVTASSATITWTGSAGSYRIVYGTGGNQTTTTTSGQQIQLTGLTGDAVYTATITAICSGGNESLAIPVVFTTGCGAPITLPYEESFESDNGSWTASGNLSSWAWGSPAKTVITGASHGTKAWTTGGLSTGTYNANEHSFLVSPCMDFSAANDVVVEFDLWWNIETTWEGAIIQYSTDNGTSWVTIGNAGDPDNWYNRSDIYTSPDGSGEGWSGHNANGSGGWITARHAVGALAGAESVKFRFNFAADGYYQFDGLAIDRFRVYDDNAACWQQTVYETTCQAGEAGTEVFTFTDINGCDSVVTVHTTLNNDAPVAQCKNITVQIGQPGTVSITPAMVDGGSSDACGLAGLALSTTQFDCDMLGQHSVTLTATDTHGNTDDCQAQVTVQDNAGNCITCSTQTIALNAGWNLISSFIEPDDPDMLDIIAAIEDDIILIKDGRGQATFPGLGIDGIGTWEVSAGYKVKCEQATQLEMGCTVTDPATTPVIMRNGWNTIAYLPEQAQAIENALAPLGSDLVLVKDGQGNHYYPQYGINQIGTMQPGLGYQVRMQSGFTFYYPTTGRGTAGADYAPATAPQRYAVTANTGNNATVIVPETAVQHLDPGDEIGVFNEAGHLVGAAVWEGRALAITLWGNDATNPAESNLLAPGEAFSFRVWKQAGHEEVVPAVSYAEGSGQYAADAISVLASLSAVVTGVNDNALTVGTTVFPNPTSGRVQVRLSGLAPGTETILTITDVSGRQVESRRITGGVSLEEIFDLSETNAGLYLLNVRAGETFRTLKIQVVR